MNCEHTNRVLAIKKKCNDVIIGYNLIMLYIITAQNISSTISMLMITLSN